MTDEAPPPPPQEMSLRYYDMFKKWVPTGTGEA